MIFVDLLIISEYWLLGLKFRQFYKPFFSKDVNFEELARCTDDFNGAQCKAVCVEAVCFCNKFNKQKKDNAVF